ncbi:MAG: peptidylprolyl isomerase [Vicinamibacteraceae bacterium]
MRNALVLICALGLGGVAAAQAPKPAAPPAAKPAPAAAKPPAAGAAARAKAGATPVFRIETAKGTMVVETYPTDAPKSFEHILALVKRRFYNGQAVHRVVAGQAVQFGDPQSRNMMLVDWWGRGPNSGSGSPIGVSEVSKTRQHRRGTVSIANAGSPAAGDSQLFIALRAVPKWDGHYTIVGQVTSGLEVADKLARGDKITAVTVTGAP